jgi:hypothetical protein
MVCLIDLKESTITFLMWLFTIILGIGVVMATLKRFGGWRMRGSIGDTAPVVMLIVGFIGATLIGIGSGKKREGFKALYGI